MFFNDLKNTIRTIPTEFPVFIYVGIGTAAGLLNAQRRLNPENYHQFPPFIQNLRNNFPTLRIILALIDPQQENPPYVVEDFNLRSNDNNIIDQYRNRDGTLQTFVWRQDVTTIPYFNNNNNNANPAAVDITQELRLLNLFAIEQRVSLLYHDFTGKPVRLLSEYFDEEISQHLDQIVYGMSAREDHGCYFDLTHANAFFPIRIEGNLPSAPLGLRLLQPPQQQAPPPPQAPPQAPHNNMIVVDNNMRPIIKMFNYYKYIVNDTLYQLPQAIAAYPFYTIETMIHLQREQIVRDYTRRFKEVQLTLLRQLRFIMLNPIEEEERAREIQFNYMFTEIHFIPRQLFLELLTAREYQTLYNELYQYIATQLNVIAGIMEMEITGAEMLQGITSDEDPYRWYNNIRLFL